MQEDPNTFIPEQVDEQIERLSGVSSFRSQVETPEQRLIQELRERYGAGTETAQAVEHVWQRLERSHGHLMTPQAAPESTSPFQRTHIAQRGGMVAIALHQKHTPWHMANNLVAALLLITLVGSMVFIARLAHQATISNTHIPTPTSTSAPTIAVPPALYVTGGADVYKLDPTSGHIEWRYNAGSPSTSKNSFTNVITTTPVVVNDTVYVVGPDRKLDALNTSNGHLRWSALLPDVILSNQLTSDFFYGQFFLDEQTLYLSSISDPNTDAGNTCSFDPANGQVLACYPLAALALHQGILYGFSGPSDVVGRITLYAFSTMTQRQLWQKPVPIPHELFEQLIYHDGVLYAVSDRVEKGYLLPSNEAYASAFDAQTGKLLWHTLQPDKDLSLAPPTGDDGTIFYSYQSLNGDSYAASATRGRVLWNWKMPDCRTSNGPCAVTAPLILPNSTIYMGVTGMSTYPSQANYLIALQTINGKQLWKHQLWNYLGAPLVLFNGLIYTSTADGKIHALNANTGSEVWNLQVAAAGLMADTPAITIAP